MKSKFLTFFGALTVMGFAFLALSGTSSAQAINNNTQQQAPSTQSAAAQYIYKAQAGDSYSVLARKAVQTYGLESKTNLTPAQIVFAETNLTQEAKSPLLNVGQQVTMNKETVKAWVEKAKALNAQQQAAWNYYVQFVDFNTNRNGQDS